MSRRIFPFLISTCILALSTILWAQTPAVTQTMSVPVVVEGGPGGKISAGQIAIFADKKNSLRVLQLYSPTDTPLRLAILIDASGSEREDGVNFTGIQEIADFAKSILRPQDKAMFVTFSTTAEATPLMSGDQLQSFQMKIARRGGTALFDAIKLASDTMKSDPEQPARRVILVISDGEDNQSRIPEHMATEAAQRTGTVIFTSTTSRYRLELRGDVVLKRLAGETGGTFFSGGEPKNLGKRFETMRRQIQNMYVATYESPDTTNSGKTYALTFKAASGSKLKLRGPDRQ
jgi:VWFA-related protein